MLAEERTKVHNVLEVSMTYRENTIPVALVSVSVSVSVPPLHHRLTKSKTETGIGSVSVGNVRFCACLCRLCAKYIMFCM